MASTATTSAITATGRHTVATMNSAARMAPAAIAAGRLRGVAAPVADVRAGPAGWPDRCWAARRREAVPGGRRGTPDGSVPMVMRPGSRRGGGGASGISPVPGRPSGCDRLSARTSPVRSRSSPPLGSSSPTSSRHTGDSVVNDDHTSTSSSSPPPAPDAAGAIRGISPVGGSVQCGSGPLSLGPKRSLRSPVSSGRSAAASGSSSGNSGPPNSSEGSLLRSPCRHMSSLI